MDDTQAIEKDPMNSREDWSNTQPQKAQDSLGNTEDRILTLLLLLFLILVVHKKIEIKVASSE